MKSVELQKVSRSAYRPTSNEENAAAHLYVYIYSPIVSVRCPHTHSHVACLNELLSLSSFSIDNNNNNHKRAFYCFTYVLFDLRSDLSIIWEKKRENKDLESGSAFCAFLLLLLSSGLCASKINVWNKTFFQIINASLGVTQISEVRNCS